MLVRVEAKESSTDTTTIATELTQKIKTFIGISVSVDVAEPGKLPRSEGKAIRVIDNREMT